MTITHFLWPKSNSTRALIKAASYTSVSRVEEQLAAMFPGAAPVLFSSGRAALLHSLIVTRLGRGDKVGVFPFASHCVLDAVARIATPTPLGSDASLNVVFQQWGYIQHYDLSPYDIEDCVDSLLLPGGKLFPGGGAFEIWSFPKIQGTTGGGVLWCRSTQTAMDLRLLRDSRTCSSLLWILRLLGNKSSLLHAWWQGAEASFGQPSRLQTGEIIAALEEWNDIVIDRKKKLDIAWQLAPSWLSRPVDRLPCVVPVELNDEVDGEELAKRTGITSGLRRMERESILGSFEISKVLPIPIHQDVTFARLMEIINYLTPFVKRGT
jgi:putative PLP-dependent aminotransferase (TIGR04422 family)